MRILIAPNAFKHSLSAPDAARAIEAGLRQSRLDCETRLFPVGDGGDGTAALLIERLGGATLSARVHDPLGREISAPFGLVETGRTAIIEFADAAGLRLLAPHELNPHTASSFGAGELILAALDRGATGIILGIGGSATIDAGAGLLQALGVRFLDERGICLSCNPEEIARVARLDLSGVDPRIARTSFTILCDVDNPLLGAQGAAAVFGPQKGASDLDIKQLETRLQRFHACVLQQLGRDIGAVPRGGAAGGVAAGMLGVLNAHLAKGIEYFLDTSGFSAAIGEADVVITGEGALDDQTLHGKAPFGVAVRAKRRGVPVAALCGRVPQKPGPALSRWFDIIRSINPPGTSRETALTMTAANLQRTVAGLANSGAFHQLIAAATAE